MAHGTGPSNPSMPMGVQGQFAGGARGAQGQPYGNQGGPLAGNNQVMIDSWFALEPVGRIHVSMSFGMVIRLYSHLELYTNLFCSQTVERSTSIRHWSQSSRRRTSTEGRDPRKTRAQVRYAAILQYHALCSLRRIFKICCWHAMRGL